MSTTETPPAPTFSRRKRIVFTLVTIAILALVAEGGARLYLRLARGYDGSHMMQYSFDPYKVMRSTPGFVDRRGVVHNRQGFRADYEVTPAKPDGTYRIFVMGGSTAYGTGGLWPNVDRSFPVLPDTGTISAYLQRVLTDRLPDGPTIEVINAGLTSAWTHQHLIYLNQSILNFDPDLILFLDGFNDFYVIDDHHDQFASYAYQDHAWVIMGDPTLKSLVYANGWWWFRRSAFVNLLGRAARGAKAILRGTPERQPLDVDAAMTSLGRVFPRSAGSMIERIGVTLRHEEVDAVFMLQPLLILERDRAGMPPHEQGLFEFNLESTMPRYEEFMRRAAPEVSAMARQSAESVGGRYLDLTGVFAGVEGQVYTDYAHLTPLGNRVVATAIADSITPIIAAQSRNP